MAALVQVCAQRPRLNAELQRRALHLQPLVATGGRAVLVGPAGSLLVQRVGGPARAARHLFGCDGQGGGGAAAPRLRDRLRRRWHSRWRRRWLLGGVGHGGGLPSCYWPGPRVWPCILTCVSGGAWAVLGGSPWGVPPTPGPPKKTLGPFP